MQRSAPNLLVNGDTIWFQGVKVRLAYIQMPEISQPVEGMLPVDKLAFEGTSVDSLETLEDGLAERITLEISADEPRLISLPESDCIVITGGGCATEVHSEFVEALPKKLWAIAKSRSQCHQKK